MSKRKVRMKVTREETWYPTYMVPEHMTADEAHEYIINEAPDQVFDEYLHKDTLDTDTSIEILEDK